MTENGSSKRWVVGSVVLGVITAWFLAPGVFVVVWIAGEKIVDLTKPDSDEVRARALAEVEDALPDARRTVADLEAQQADRVRQLSSDAYSLRNQHCRSKVIDQSGLSETVAVQCSETRAVRDPSLTARMALRGGLAYTWQELTCSVEPDDPGFDTSTYLQICALHQYGLIPIAQAPPGDCKVLYASADSVDERFPAPFVSVLKGRTPPARPGVDTWNCLNEYLDDPLVPFGEARETRLAAGTRPRTLKASPGWVLISIEVPVSKTDLGCARGGFLFCDAPFEQPAMPTLP